MSLEQQDGLKGFDNYQAFLDGEIWKWHLMMGQLLGRRRWDKVEAVQRVIERLIRAHKSTDDLARYLAEQETLLLLPNLVQQIIELSDTPIVTLNEEVIGDGQQVTVSDQRPDNVVDGDKVQLPIRQEYIQLDDLSNYPFAPHLEKYKIRNTNSGIRRDPDGLIIGIRDLQDRQITITPIPFALNNKEDGFLYETLDSAIDDIYEDKRAQYKHDPKHFKQIMSASIGGVHQAYFGVEERFKALAELEQTGRLDMVAIPDSLAGALQLIRAHDLYANLTMVDLHRVFTRDMTFDELLTRSTHLLDTVSNPQVSDDGHLAEAATTKEGISLLNDGEIYILMQLLLNNYEGWGLDLTKEQVNRLIERHKQLEKSNGLSILNVEAFFDKLSAFFNPDTRLATFEAHEHLPSAQELLLYIAVLNQNILGEKILELPQASN